MNGDYYADEFRRYNTYVRDYTAGEHIYRVACGPNAFDFKWTEQVMRKVPGQADGLSLHYYTVPYNWDHKALPRSLIRKIMTVRWPRPTVWRSWFVAIQRL